MNRRVALCALILGAVLLTSCTAYIPDVQREYATGGKREPDKVLVVGRVDLVPALRKDEQKLEGLDVIGYYRLFRRRALFYLNDAPRPVAEDGKAINPELGKLYVFQIPRSDRYIVGGYVLMKFGTGDRRLRIPLGMKLDIAPGDRAIYIGDIRLSRDEFDEVTNIQVIDNYAKASAEFARLYGHGIALRKAMPRPL